ncbi:MAG: hypothetical protein AB7F43_10510 [Bacteriovoracia bacterium]
MNTKRVIVLIALAAVTLGATGCSKSSEQQQQPQPITTPGNPSTVPPQPGPTPPMPTTDYPLPNSAAGCNGKNQSLITGPAYSYQISGVGNNPVNINLPVMSDQLLKIQVEPGNAVQTQGSSSAQNYGQLSLDVALIANGQERGSKSFNGGTDYYGKPNGIVVGHSLTQDFSNYLVGNATYSLQIRNIKSDYMCKTACSSYSNQSYTSCYSVDWYTCSYWSSWGYFQYGGLCCGPDYTMFNQCASIQCNVGPVQTSAGWTATIRVETMSTSCLQDN